ncbi:MAG: hemerythrin family protein [Candidatus Thiodiazotropha sp. (ex Lucina aurantia)]|uniref:Bacteriohemerythrin n=2 Tax=Candidatus Thiodiazotropha TaxID=1913444 RepID=A0A7Z1AE39_9GAMM|nr:hemerythrin family protein [Candidatus Thiodiazotropha endolucinida]MBT3011688.1 hemerythrin family protein [Candidatus Thiodiazotropha sp. (ex Lucina pensylvanica)]MBT3017721.1 hemerythrin family protein [Candidatus Thiodiazotropha taylori]MBT3043332.1 hemerythrin family protein [Candidatus Thiodiazotropha sp. (ex Codakia orbicularis)]MBV2103891.1 hemerythrin family protein [Candidatus Thiodiazotropha sp. (ex Lucina aurantia)]MBT3025034.1 hemerythrin family protein [Candidatus Thiodiazotro
MINIDWDTNFEVGHERIDSEHRVFLNLIRTISTEVEANSNKERILRLLAELVKYAEFHFLSEENEMLRVDYPGYDEHRHEHEKLLTKFTDMMAQFRSGALPLDSIVEFVFLWFALHTTQVDKRLGEYIQQNDKL